MTKLIKDLSDAELDELLSRMKVRSRLDLSELTDPYLLFTLGCFQQRDEQRLLDKVFSAYDLPEGNKRMRDFIFDLACIPIVEELALRRIPK